MADTELPKLEPQQTKRYYELEGETMCLSQWATRLGMSFSTLKNRLNRGMTLREVVATPVRKKTPPKNGGTPHGKKPVEIKAAQKEWIRSPTRVVWRGMVSRCTYADDPSHKFYMARGITVCDEWRDYYNFLRDMGERPKGTSLDRIDNEKGYCKENCRWATPKEQARNKRSNRLISYNGETKCVAQWAEDLGIPDSILRSRLHRGWDFEKAIAAPSHTTNKEK